MSDPNGRISASAEAIGEVDPVAMGAAKGQAATQQVEMVCLDELVPADDRYRRIDELVDFSFVRTEAAPCYAVDVGRPSIDPIVLIKLMLAGAIEGIGSMRELLRVATLRVDLRRFLGYGFGERLPVHQTISHAQTRRFLDARLFERLFTRTVALCSEHGLIDGSHLSVDGFHAEADAALASLRASLAPAGEPAAEGEEELVGEHGGAGAEEEPAASGRPQLRLAEPRSGPTPKRRSSNETSHSRTDPDAKLRGKPGQRPHLVHRGQVAVDPRARCVVSCIGEQADGHEGDALVPVLERSRFCCPELSSVGADQGFAAERVWKAVAAAGVTAYVPPQRTMLPKGEEPTSAAQREALAARERCKSERGVWAHKRRMADAEGVIGELKSEHGLGRARCRGTPLFHLQLLLGCAALNLKRLASHAGEAAAGSAAQPAGGEARTPGAPSEPVRAVHAVVIGTESAVERRAAAPAALLWSFSVSLN